MAHWKTISEHEHRSERLNRLCKMKKFTDNFLRSQSESSFKLHASLKKIVGLNRLGQCPEIMIQG